MNEEEKQAIHWLKEELDDEKKSRKNCNYSYKGVTGLYGNNEVEIALKLIEKQQKEIEFYKMQELEYMAGYEDGKSHKQTAVAIRNENAQYELIQRHIQNLKDELKEERALNVEALKTLKECVHKDKIKEKIEFYKGYGKIKNTNVYVMSVEIEVLKELLEEGK